MKKHITQILIAAFAAIFLAGCGQHLKFGNIKYRVNGAQNATLGGIGYKSGGFLANTFEPHAILPLTDVPVKVTREESRSKITKSKLEASGVLSSIEQVEAEAKANRIRNSIESGRYRIFTILERDQLIERLNDPTLESKTHPLKFRTGRVITSIVLVYDHNSEIESVIEASASAKLATNDSGGITFTNSNDETVTISNESVIAYEYARIQVDSNGKVSRVKTDRIGVDTRN